MQKRIFQDRLRQIMDDTGTNQSKVAEVAQVTQPTVSRWLEGQMPKADDVYRLGTYFNRSMDWFFGAPNQMAPSTAPGDPIPEKPSLDQFHAMAETAQTNANALRSGAERFGRLPEMIPRIEALEREAAALKAMVEEMVAGGYSPIAEPTPPQKVRKSPLKTDSPAGKGTALTLEQRTKALMAEKLRGIGRKPQTPHPVPGRTQP